MDLDQHIHAEAPRLGNHASCSFIVQQRQHDEDCIRSGDAGLGDLAKIEEEILGEDGAVETPPSGSYVAERTAEIHAVAKYAERVSDTRITARQHFCVGTRSDCAGRRRRFLDLEDEAGTVPYQHRGKAPLCRFCARAKRIERHAVEPPRQFFAFTRDNLAEDAFSHGSNR